MDSKIAHGAEEPLVRRTPGPPLSIQQFILLLCTIASGGMLTGSLLALVSDRGALGYLKAFFCVLGGVAVSYGVNRCALDRGAPLTVVGYRVAAVASILSILVVGGGLFAATYSGLVLKDVERLRLEAYGTELAEHIGQRAGELAAGLAMAPVLASIAADLEQKTACERASSCVSGRNNGGRGLVARTLEAMAERAKAVAVQFTSGVSASADKTAEIAALLARYGEIASGDDPAAEKRAKLREIDAQVRQAVADRKDSVPVGLALGYAAELQAGAVIHGQPDVSKALAPILQTHARSLRAAAVGSTATPTAPAFPKPAGVADTFAYLGHFIPIAAITAVVEMVFPIVLWVYVTLTLAWEIERRAPRQVCAPHEDDDAARRILGKPHRSHSSDIADPEAYFHGPAAWRAPDDYRHGNP